eukprot:CAMPEP_0174754916 /NCGR_PEP_ID=MMETSP1094-20130205/105983_1 /TAXON_ID=156173 /ORGANISM="Chrysochromulina brevifilum, Strain UTEX LB 985" /LENGTH=34 /DNA_ID= /DNA_START= /DNA_END= /DNA_ORIENTATION=
MGAPAFQQALALSTADDIFGFDSHHMAIDRELNE